MKFLLGLFATLALAGSAAACDPAFAQSCVNQAAAVQFSPAVQYAPAVQFAPVYAYPPVAFAPVVQQQVIVQKQFAVQHHVQRQLAPRQRAFSRTVTRQRSR